MNRLKFVLVIAVSFLIIFSGISLFLTTLAPLVPEAHATTDSVNLQGSFQAWNFTQTVHNPTITVHAGDTVSILLQSKDGNTHQFLLDADNDGGSLTDDCNTVDACSVLFGGAGNPSQTTFSFPVNLAPGNYTYYCSIHFTSMLGIFQVLPDFTMSASPTAATVAPGGSSNFTISMTSFGFSGTVGLSSSVPPAATGVTAVLSPPNVALTSGSTGSSTLKVSTTSSSPLGTFSITVTGTSGKLSHSTVVMLTITNGVLGARTLPLGGIYILVVSVGLVGSLLSLIAFYSVTYRRRNRTQ